MTNKTPTRKQLRTAYEAGENDSSTFDILLEAAREHLTSAINEETDIDFDNDIINAYIDGFCGHSVPYKLN